jgi:hypothetical protein
MSRLVDISSERESYAWQAFSGSDPQIVLHNHLETAIEEHRTKLETATGEEVQRSQTAIRELRALLGFIHGKDSEQIRKVYG